jgi:hypothetical protein
MFTKNRIVAKLPPMMFVSTLPSGRTPDRRTEPCGSCDAAKNLEPDFSIWIYCNPLKSPKTANTFLGKAWHWNHTSLEMFAKNLEAGRPRRPRPDPHTFRGVPPNAAGRFSRNARTPSAKSGVNPSSR